MYEFFILKVLATIVSAVYASYLLYVRYHPSVADRKLQKYEVGTREYILYKKTYTPHFLIIVLTTALTFILDLALDIFGLIHGSIPFSLKMAVFAINMMLSLVGLYLICILLSKSANK